MDAWAPGAVISHRPPPCSGGREADGRAQPSPTPVHVHPPTGPRPGAGGGTRSARGHGGGAGCTSTGVVLIGQRPHRPGAALLQADRRACRQGEGSFRPW